MPQVTEKYIVDNLPADIPCPPDDSMARNLKIYLQMLLDWNRAFNLAGTNDARDILRNLMVDSFYLAHFLRELLSAEISPTMLDLGAGAGLPGIPLRMAWQNGNYIMVENREKRAIFLANVLARVPLPRTFIFRGLAEKSIKGDMPDPLGKIFHKGLCKCILARAFKPVHQLADMCRPQLSARDFLILLVNDLPENISGWKQTAEYSYMVKDRKRHFLALSPA